MHQMVMWLVDVIRTWGYPGIFTLMFLESTCVPVPSEFVMPPAGYLVSQGEMNLFVVIALGTIGNIGGEHFEKAERFLVRHGEIGTFTGRLILGVRHFISLPAGLARMNIFHFILYTALGAGIWDSILTMIGWVAGNNQALIMKYYHWVTIGMVAVCVVILGVYVYFYRKRRAAAAAQGS